jgi:hypothetical protein
MSMNKRLQIPITSSEEKLLKSAARKNGLTLAEWARSLLREKAREDLGPKRKSPEDALKSLFSANAPIDTVEAMAQESFRGRYK